MDVTTASRFHTGEIIFSSLLRIRVILILGVYLWEFLLYETLMFAVVQFHHANIALPHKIDKALRAVIVTPAMHKVHHSRCLFEKAIHVKKIQINKLKVPPAITTVVCALIMWAIYEYFSWNSLHFSLSIWIPVSTAFIGGLLGLTGLIQFYFHQASVDPHRPDKVGTLVRKGPYRFSRNPMYLGLLLILFVWSIYLGNSLAFLFYPCSFGI